MFAGAAREAVFSRADVIARINAGFVPVALKAALVNNPPPGPEGRLYREIGRSRPVPQGICVANSAGKVLAWALSFDDEASVPAFLDHALALYRRHPDATAAVPAERYRKFPGARLADVADTRARLPVPAAHAEGEPCPALPRRAAGTLVARVVGRAVEADGTLSRETNRQECYVEDTFDIPPAPQEALARAVAAAGGARVPVPAGFARRLVTYAYLGQLDVRPLDSPVPQHRADIERIELHVRADGPLLRLEGTSEVKAGTRGARSDGATFVHAIELRWRGFLKLEDRRLVDLVLLADGFERLRWGHPAFGAALDAEPDCAHLPAGRPLDFDGRVRYALMGTATAPAGGVRARLRQLEEAIARMVRDGREQEALALLDAALARLEQKRKGRG